MVKRINNILKVIISTFFSICSVHFLPGKSSNMSENPTSFFEDDIREVAVLEKLGYRQELKRSFGLLGMIGFSFSIVTCWTALSGVLIIGVVSGGPLVMIYSWIGICIFSLAVAYSMAEICSAYPVAGGQYSWVAVLAPPRVARGMSWITGWFMITGMRLPHNRYGVKLIDLNRHSSHGCNEQFYRSQFYPWPS